MNGLMFHHVDRVPISLFSTIGPKHSEERTHEVALRKTQRFTQAEEQILPSTWLTKLKLSVVSQIRFTVHTAQWGEIFH